MFFFHLPTPLITPSLSSSLPPLSPLFSTSYHHSSFSSYSLPPPTITPSSFPPLLLHSTTTPSLFPSIAPRSLPSPKTHLAHLPLARRQRLMLKAIHGSIQVLLRLTQLHQELPPRDAGALEGLVGLQQQGRVELVQCEAW